MFTQVRDVSHQQCPCKKILYFANVCFSAHAIQNHVDTQSVKRFKRAVRFVYDIKSGMLQVRKNETSLRKCSGGSAHLRTSEGTLVTRESARFDNNDSEPKSQVRLLKFPEENYYFLRTHIFESILSFSQCQNENECFSRRGNCRPQSGRIMKWIVRLLEKFQARFDCFQEWRPCFAFLVNPFNVNALVMAVQLADRLLQTCPL